MECRKEINLKICNCTYEPCPRKCRCCECIPYHKNMGELPACFFNSVDERTYDRSIDFFIETHKR